MSIINLHWSYIDILGNADNNAWLRTKKKLNLHAKYTQGDSL